MLNFKDKRSLIRRKFEMVVKDVTCDSFYKFRNEVYNNANLHKYVWMKYEGNDIRGDVEIGIHDYFSLEYEIVTKIFTLASEILEQG